MSWTPSSWRDRPARQLPDYPDPSALARVESRLGSAAHAAGWSGPVEPLGFFFKDPLGDGPHALGDQWRALCDFVAALPARPARPGASEGGDDAPAS